MAFYSIKDSVTLRIMDVENSPSTWLADHGDTLFRYANLRVREQSIAEDLVQETLLAAIGAYKNFSGKSSVRTWLTSIMKHKIVDYYRKKREEYQVEDINSLADQPDDDFEPTGHWKHTSNAWQNPDLSLEKEQFWETMNRCIENLPPHLADIYILREVNGMNSEDLRKALDISTTNNLWVILSRARKQLRNCLEQHWFKGSL